jgi:tetratricopeptide (TPR) repeat protein
MAIRGSLSEAGLPDVLQLVSLGGKTGCLGLSRGTEFGFIYFDAGRISHASVVNRQLSTEESVFLLFTWTDGTFSFEPGVVPGGEIPRESIDPQSLLLEGARRVDEWTLIRKKISSLDLVFALDRQKLLGTRFELTQIQQQLLPLIDGHRDVASLIRDSGYGEFVVAKELYGLVSAGFVVPVGKTAPVATRVSHADEYRNLAIAFYRAAMFDEAIREFETVLDLKPGDAAAGFYLGLIALQRRDWQTAAAYFQRTASVVPDAIAPRHNFVVALLRNGEVDKAEAGMAELLEYGGRSDPTALTISAALALMRGDPLRADADLHAARELMGDARPVAAWFHYAGLTAALRGDLERARALLEEGVQLHTTAAPLLNNLAVVYERLGRYDLAREAVERGIALNATLSQLHTNLGDLLLQTGEHVSAHAAYRRARQVAGG